MTRGVADPSFNDYEWIMVEKITPATVAEGTQAPLKPAEPIEEQYDIANTARDEPNCVASAAAPMPCDGSGLKWTPAAETSRVPPVVAKSERWN